MVGELTIPGGIAATTVADAAAGDADALARIVSAHHDDMARICYVICDDQNMAQDAVQSAWPIAWRRLGSLHDPERLRPWLMAVAESGSRAACLEPNTMPPANPSSSKCRASGPRRSRRRVA